MAARMIVYGYRSGEIAQQLRVNRHTVAIWKRNPAFRVELNRLHAYATAAILVVAISFINIGAQLGVQRFQRRYR